MADAPPKKWWLDLVKPALHPGMKQRCFLSSPWQPSTSSTGGTDRGSVSQPKTFDPYGTVALIRAGALSESRTLKVLQFKWLTTWMVVLKFQTSVFFYQTNLNLFGQAGVSKSHGHACHVRICAVHVCCLYIYICICCSHSLSCLQTVMSCQWTDLHKWEV